MFCGAQVASEDKVPYTAQAYMDGQTDEEQRPAALQVMQVMLAPLVRCPHLRPFWLTVASRLTDVNSILFGRRSMFEDLAAIQLV